MTKAERERKRERERVSESTLKRSKKTLGSNVSVVSHVEDQNSSVHYAFLDRGVAARCFEDSSKVGAVYGNACQENVLKRTILIPKNATSLCSNQINIINVEL